MFLLTFCQMVLGCSQGRRSRKVLAKRFRKPFFSIKELWMKTEISHESKPCRNITNVYCRHSSICSIVQPNKQENSFELIFNRFKLKCKTHDEIHTRKKCSFYCWSYFRCKLECVLYLLLAVNQFVCHIILFLMFLTHGDFGKQVPLPNFGK